MYNKRKKFFIERICLKNFRNFREINLDLEENLNVIVGINGAGKTALLDALAISLSTLFNKIDTSNSLPISRDDANRLVYEIGNQIDFQSQFPVEVSSIASVAGQKIKWKRELNSSKSKTTIKDAKEIIEYGLFLQDRVSSGDKETILPLLAYYGTSRLYTKKTEWNKSYKRYPSRLDGYIDALVPMTNEKRMVQWFEEMQLIELEEGKPLPEFKAVKEAMIRCLSAAFPNYSGIKINYSVKRREIEISYFDLNEPRILTKLPLRLMSDGIKIMLGLVADIAQRMGKLNPQLLFEVVCRTPGVVLIDEVDMHLHPKWQSRILGSLQDVFPEVQFIITTHSPIVISNTKPECLIILDGERPIRANHSYGKSIKNILREIMQVEDYRPRSVVNDLNDLYSLIDRGEVDQAEKKLQNLKKILGAEDSEIVSAEYAIDIEGIFED